MEKTQNLIKGTCFTSNNQWYKIYTSTKQSISIVGIELQKETFTKETFYQTHPNSEIVHSEEFNQRAFNHIEQKILNIAEKLTKETNKKKQKSLEKEIKTLRKNFSQYCPEIIKKEKQ